METKSSFYLTLPSNSCETIYSDNKPQNFKVQLSQPLQLDGQWEAALTEIQYPHYWKNFPDSTLASLTVGFPDDSGQEKDESKIKSVKDLHPSKSIVSVTEYGLSLDDGYFDSAKDILESIIDAVKSVSGSKVDIYYKINKHRQDGLLQVVQPALLKIINGGEHFRALGFVDRNTKKVKESSKFPIMSTVPFSVHQPTLYIYCDFIRYQFVGDTLAPLLRAVPSSGNFGDNITETFIRPYYLPVSKGYINTIEIKICDEAGKPINFQSGKVVCILHLRRWGI